MTTLFSWLSHGCQKRRQNIITALKTLPQGWVLSHNHQCKNSDHYDVDRWLECCYVRYIIWVHCTEGFARLSFHIRIREHLGLWAFSWELHSRWQLDRALKRWWQWGAKGLITPPSRWVSAQLLYVCVTAWQRSWQCSQKLCSSFLRAVRLFIYLFTLIRLRGTIFPYQECNNELHYITQHNFFPYHECN